jgi:hypothetical protein
MRRRFGGRVGAALFLIGTVSALALAALAAWADFEGFSYFTTGAGYARFDGLNCPIVISRSETGMVQAWFDNPTDQAIQPYYQVEVSGPSAARQLEGQITVEPHASRAVTWAVDAGDIDLGFFILVKLDVLPSAGYDTREATCGILVANPGSLRGDQATSAGVVFASLCMLGGLLLPVWGMNTEEAAKFDREASTNAQRVRQALGLASAAALLTALLGGWMATFVLLAVSLLLLTLSLQYRP